MFRGDGNPDSFVHSRTNFNIMRKQLILIALALVTMPAWAQKKKTPPVEVPALNQDSALWSKVKYRLLGPWRGGRSAAATGSYRQRNTFYFGATGGGVWKTTDGGSNWKNISDKYFGGTIGASSWFR